MCNVSTCGKSHISKKKPTNCPKLCIDSTNRTPVTTYTTTKTSIAENTLESSCKNKYPVSQNISKCVISNCCQRSAPSASTTRMKLCPAKEKNKIVIKKDCPWKGENLLVVGRRTICKQETKTNVSEMNSEIHAPDEIVSVETEVVKVTSISTFRKNIKLYESQAETIVKKISSELPSSTHSIKHFSVTKKAISIENDDHSGRNNGNANQVNDDTDAKNEEEVDLNETIDGELSPEIDSKIPDGRKVSVESLVQEKEKKLNLVSEVEIASTIESSNPNIENGPEKYLSVDITTTETSESNSKETDDNSQHISIKSHSPVGSTQMTEPSENVQNPPVVNDIEGIKEPNSKNSGVISQHAQTAKLSFKCKGDCQCFMDPGMGVIKELNESDETPNNSSRNVPPHITAENSSVESEISTATIPRSPIESTLVEIVSTTDTSETDTKNISKESAPVEIKSTSKSSETNSKSYGKSALPDNIAAVNPQHSQPARASIKCKGKCCECSLELRKSEILELAEKSNKTPYNSIENLLPHTSDEEFSIGKKSSDANILSSFSGSTQKTETKEGVQESAGMKEKDDDRTEKECRCPQKNDDKKIPSKNILEKISIENLVPKESNNHQNYVSEDSPVETVPVDETSESNTNNLEEECRGTCENYLEHEQCEIQEVVKRTDETSHISIRNDKEFSDTAIPIPPPRLTKKTKTESEGQESTEFNEIGDNDRTEKECECIQESNKKIFSEIDTKYTEKKVHSIELATTTTTIPESNKKNIPEKYLPVENTSAKITSNHILEKNETEAYMNTITEEIPQNTSLSFKCKGHCQCFLELKRDETQGLTKNNEENSQIPIRNSLPHTTEEVVSAEKETSKVTIPIVPGVSQEIEADENVQPSELNNPQHSQTAGASIICKGNCECSLDLGKSKIQELGEKTNKTPYNSIENLLPHTTDEEFSTGKKSSDANILSSFSGSTQKTEAKEGIQEAAETEEKCEYPQNVVPVVNNTTQKNEKDDIGLGNKIKSTSKNCETNSKSYGISALPDNIAGVNPQHSQPARASIKCKGNCECSLELGNSEILELAEKSNKTPYNSIENLLPRTSDEEFSIGKKSSDANIISSFSGSTQKTETKEGVQESAEMKEKDDDRTEECRCPQKNDDKKIQSKNILEKISIENLVPKESKNHQNYVSEDSPVETVPVDETSESNTNNLQEKCRGTCENYPEHEQCEIQEVVKRADETSHISIRNEKDFSDTAIPIPPPGSTKKTKTENEGQESTELNEIGDNDRTEKNFIQNSEEVVAVDEYSTEKILSKSASPYQVCHEENACFLKNGDLVISENMYECISEQCREEFLKKESECDPDVKKSIIKLALDKADKPGEYVVLRGPMFVRKSLLDHSSTPKEVQDKVKPMISDTVKSFLDCKRCCREGKCIAKELLNICKSDPDGIIEMYRSQTVDRPYLEQDNLLSDVFQMQKTHGEVYGDQKYHYLMVDKTASVDDTMFQNETKEETVRKETFSDYDETSLEKGAQVPVRRRSEFSSIEQVSDVTESSFAIPAGEKHIPVEQEHIPVEDEHIPGEEKHRKESHIDVVEQKTSSVVIEPEKKSLEEFESKELDVESEEREAEPKKLEAARSDFENFRQSRVTRESNISWEAPLHHKASATLPSADSIEKLAEDAKKRRERFLGNTNQKKTKSSAFEDILKEEKEKTDSRGPSKLEANSPSMASKESIDSAVQTKCCGMKKKKKSPKKPPEKKVWEKANRKSTISHISRLDGYDTDPETTSDHLAKQHAFSFESDGSSSLRAHSRVENPILEEQRRLSKYSNV